MKAILGSGVRWSGDVCLAHLLRLIDEVIDELRVDSLSINGASVATFSYDDQDRLLTYGATAYTYTANGELASKSQNGQTIAYDYDVTGSLRQVVLEDGLVIDYVVDAAHRRVGERFGGILARGFLYQDQLNPVAVLDGAGHMPDYMVGPGVTPVASALLKQRVDPAA